MSYGSFYKDKWLLGSGISAYSTLFESNFVNMTLGNYDWVDIANSKARLFMITSNTVIIEYKIFNSEKVITKVAELKLWLVY